MRITAKIECPHCGGFISRVTDSRAMSDGQRIARTRRCEACQQRYVTEERIIRTPGSPRVVPKRPAA